MKFFLKAFIVCCLAIALGMFAPTCKAALVFLSPTETGLIGKWESNNETGRIIITRFPNKTFVSEESVVYYAGKPPVTFTAEGTWRVKGDNYILKYTKVSNPMFNARLKHAWAYQGLKVSGNQVEFMAEDTPVISEKKIGEAIK